MQLQNRPLSKHRHARLIAATLAMLLWLAQVLFAGGPFSPRHERQRARRMSLQRLTKQVKLLIVSRAFDAFRWRRPRRVRRFRGRSIAPRTSVDAIIGMRLKRQLKRKHVGERIGVLIHALLNIDAYAAGVAKRLRRGLTRRWLAVFAIAWPLATTVPFGLALTPTFADSS
ncbi:MAG: hypothetical protein AB7T58_18170 [Hyphomonadaceae bacterium]